MYGQTIESQLENAQTRLASMLKAIRDNMAKGALDVPAINAFLEGDILQRMVRLNGKIVCESKVKAGAVAEICKETFAAAQTLL